MLIIYSTDLFQKSMYVMTQFHYYLCILATMKVNKLQIIFVTSTQTKEHVATLKFSEFSILKFSHLDIVVVLPQYLYYLWLNLHLNFKKLTVSSIPCKTYK